MDIKRGLVLEGGAMRGLFTAGILDVMMENDIASDGIVGVSAGACFGCNYKSRQPGRAIRYNMQFARDKRYSGLRSWLTTGNVFNAEFAYHVVPTTYDPFDFDTYNANPMEFHVVCTDVHTGEAVYHRLDTMDREGLEWIRASSSLPLVSRIVEVGGRQLLDGGLADSVPLPYFQRLGYDRNIVILTRPRDYVKSPMSHARLLRWLLRKHPAVARAMLSRYRVYREQVEYAHHEAEAGRALVLQPDADLGIPHVCHDADLMRRVYDTGRALAERRLQEIKAFLEQDFRP